MGEIPIHVPDNADLIFEESPEFIEIDSAQPFVIKTNSGLSFNSKPKDCSHTLFLTKANVSGATLFNFTGESFGVFMIRSDSKVREVRFNRPITQRKRSPLNWADIPKLVAIQAVAVIPALVILYVLMTTIMRPMLCLLP